MAMKTESPNLWDTEKAVLREKFLTIPPHARKQEKSQINNLNLHLKQLEKEEQQNKNKQPKVSRRKEIIAIRAEINVINKKQTKKPRPPPNPPPKYP